MRAGCASPFARLREDAGPFQAGTSYRADQLDLLLWILFTLVDSILVVYPKYVRALSEREPAALWDDYKIVGRLFGLNDADMRNTRSCGRMKGAPSGRGAEAFRRRLSPTARRAR